MLQIWVVFLTLSRCCMLINAQESTTVVYDDLKGLNHNGNHHHHHEHTELSAHEKSEQKAKSVFHALQLMHNFTVNWTIDKRDVIEEKSRQWHIFTGPDGDFKEGKIDNQFSTGLSNTTILMLFDVFKITPEFKQRLIDALGQCDYYVDDEFRFLEDRTVSIFRYGFIRQVSNVDKFATVASLYQVQLTKLDAPTETFLRCISGYGSHDCQLPPQMSEYDYQAFKVWFRALSISQFMQDQLNNHRKLGELFESLEEHLPPGYAGLEPCSIWPHTAPGCGGIYNPKFAVGLSLMETWNVTMNPLLMGTHETIPSGWGLRRPTNINCSLSQQEAYADVIAWIGLADPDFIRIMNHTVAAFDTSHDNIIIRDMFHSKQPGRLDYDRVFVVYDRYLNVYHGAALFLSGTVEKLSEPQQLEECPLEALKCSSSKIRFFDGDADMKSLAVNTGVKYVKSVKS